MFLKTQALSKSFGQLAALSDVSFGVEENEIFGIAGPNGAGKSTLFNVVAGLYQPSSGKILFQGEDITRLSAHQVCQRGIGRTFQVPTRFSSLSIRDNVRVGAIFGAGREDHVPEILDFLGLSVRADAPATNLDLYTAKLVMVGAALATGCKLLMLDEPMAGFSVVEIEDFKALVQKINGGWDITIIIIEHLLDTLIDISDRMMILNDGRVLYIGLPERVTQDPTVVDVYLGGRRGKHHA